ncbi:amidase [Arthrobacter sp. GAS37]|uniref:amidase n=1 Tax=Arthrobacter sp. GAS37 TaxID=3156261 RepID=UPI00383752C8
MTSPINLLSAVVLTAEIRKKNISAREALEAHFEQIDAVNPAINAVVTQDRVAAAAAAAAADNLTASGVELPPLHGVPMTHKDTHNTKGMRTTQGSPIFADYIPSIDDVIIQRLKRAGVVSTGKSNVPEFAAGAHTFNDVFGTTTNPFSTGLSAGGSSGGVAAALASRIQSIGDGSDMGGSLRIPASFCNVVGFRPSLGLIPLAPTRNAWAWLGRAGIMAREVGDVALAMSAVSGRDARTPFDSPVQRRRFAEPLETDLSGLRIGWSPDFGVGVPVQREVLSVLEAQLNVFRDLGAHVEEAAPDLRDADLVFANTRAFDFLLGLGDVVDKHGDQVKAEVLWNIERGRGLTSRDLVETALARTRLHDCVQEYFGRYDAFISPCSQVLPFEAAARYPTEIEGVPLDTYLDWMRSVSLVSAAGIPAISVPAGFSDDGLPVGIQIAMNHGKDFELLQLGHGFEQATGFAQKLPQLLDAPNSH